MPRRLTLAAALMVLGSACTTLPDGGGATSRWPEEASGQVLLDGTPFFPQEAYQCGPAALATVLAGSGIEVEPDDLVDEVWLPARRGSLQTELLAATRQRERIAYVIGPALEALVSELDAGRPVLVLLDLGVKARPVWHYAVVIGYDRDKDQVLLRSGTTELETLSRRRFDHAWVRASRWGFVALKPGELPGGKATAPRYAAAVGDLEASGKAGDALVAYQAGLHRWTGDPILGLGAANTRWAIGDVAGAEAGLREVLRMNPREAAARNNLADILAQRGCLDAAAAEIALARRDAEGTALQSAVEMTSAEIAARAGGAAGGEATGAECPSAPAGL